MLHSSCPAFDAASLTFDVCCRLATVQDTRPPQVPHMALESKEVGEHEKMAILESIRAMVPDHETRVHSLEVSEGPVFMLLCWTMKPQM